MTGSKTICLHIFKIIKSIIFFCDQKNRTAVIYGCFCNMCYVLLGSRKCGKKRILVTKFVNENVIRLGFSMKEGSQ